MKAVFRVISQLSGRTHTVKCSCSDLALVLLGMVLAFFFQLFKVTYSALPPATTLGYISVKS